MTWRPRLADVLLCGCALLLVLAVAHRVRLVETVTAQARADKALFTRYIQQQPGSFGRASIRAGTTADVVCARRHRAVAGSKSLRRQLCISIPHRSGHVRVARVQAPRIPRWARPVA
jgi:hypothetical protein